MVVRAWLNPDGTVERVSFATLKDAKADADLRAILTRGNIGEAPPPEMLQPLNLRFRSTPGSDAGFVWIQTADREWLLAMWAEPRESKRGHEMAVT
jgi:hypothetical protein